MRLALAVLILVIVPPALAIGAEPADEGTAAAVAAVYGYPADCSHVVVSTASPRYARWDIDLEACVPEGDGFGIARRDDAGKWHDVYQASEDSAACPTTPLPTGVGVDLHACSRPSKHTYIEPALRNGPLFKPRALPHGAHSLMSRLRWRGWDRSVATASGVLDYADAYDRFRAPLRLRAWRVRFCGTKRVYTRLTLKFVRDSDRRRFGHFEGTSDTGCGEGSETAVYTPRAG